MHMSGRSNPASYRIILQLTIELIILNSTKNNYKL